MLRDIPERDSLGHFYLQTIRFLGYGMFDEYKVMGLAPYGDPSRYRALFRTMYTLLPEGAWAINFDRILGLYDVLSPRASREPIAQVHKDVAAALQEALETIVLHCLHYYRRETGQENLCFSGGVAHNCTMNGRSTARACSSGCSCSRPRTTRAAPSAPPWPCTCKRLLGGGLPRSGTCTGAGTSARGTRCARRSPRGAISSPWRSSPTRRGPPPS
ncbi:carbamoyltransferase N-terminal domain-containing protein [Sorangium sp. So ce1078]|uniref:carbamoyltransferase N-terminal domain-containing protein n=1 Tax=Sorangium sp. So ce1078 TaxID=3133329 RepID=UPI003F5ECCBB